jgi:hypothetical protein
MVTTNLSAFDGICRLISALLWIAMVNIAIKSPRATAARAAAKEVGHRANDARAYSDHTQTPLLWLATVGPNALPGIKTACR